MGGYSKRRSPGVYAITCIANRKVYIGSANRITKRRGQHYEYLRRGVHKLAELQKDYNSYGEDLIVFTVIEECSADIADSDLLAREGVWIDRYGSIDSRYGYNIVHPVTGKEVVGEFANRRKPRENIRKGIPTGLYVVDVVTGDTKFYSNIREYISANSGYKESSIRNAFAYWNPESVNASRAYMGKMFIRQHVYNAGYDYISYKRPRKKSERVHKEKVIKAAKAIESRNLGRKEVRAMCMVTGNEKVFTSAVQAANHFDVKSGKVYSCLSGTKKSTRGQRFEYTGKCERVVNSDTMH